MKYKEIFNEFKFNHEDKLKKMREYIYE